MSLLKKIFHKKEEKFVTDQWRDGEITAEQIFEEESEKFYHAFDGFATSKYFMIKAVAQHNENNGLYQKRVDDIANGADYPEKGLDLTLLKLHSEDRAGMQPQIDLLQSSVRAGYLRILGLAECNAVRENPDFVSRDVMVERCVELFKQESEEMSIDQEADLRKDLEKFYDMCYTYMWLNENTENDTNAPDPESMFYADGSIKYIRNGNKMAGELSPLREFVEIDYKGVLDKKQYRAQAAGERKFPGFAHGNGEDV